MINGIVNGAGGSNTLLAPNGNNTWNITSDDGGTVAGITFVSIQNLTGGTMSDHFIFDNGISVAGVVNGGLGTNTLDYTAYFSPVAVNIGAGTATATGGFSNIQDFIGGMNIDTLTGPNAATTWSITATDAGNINSSAFIFSSFENLTGGSGNDTFDFTPGFMISGIVDGGAGSNTLLAPNTPNTWNITSSNGGTVAGIVFISVQNLTGGSSSDDFILNSAVASNVSGVLNGGGGINTLDYSAFSSSVMVNIEAGRATSTGGIENLQNFIGGTGVNTLTGPASTFWVITGLNSGTINGIYNFTAFANLIGGSGDDTFDFTPGFLITGTVNGGPGSNTLLAPNTNNVWHITSQNAGNVSGITFSNIENLTGGSMNDQFVFAKQQGVLGVVDGGGLPVGNVLDYTLFTIPAFIVFTSPTGGTASNLGVGFIDIGSIVGNFTFVKIQNDHLLARQTYPTQLSLSYLLATPLWYDLFNRLQLEMNEVVANTNRLWVEVHAKVKERQKNYE